MQDRKNRSTNHVFVSMLALLLVVTGGIAAQPDASARNPNRLQRPRGQGRNGSGQSSQPNQYDQTNTPQGDPNNSGEDFNIGIRKDVIDDGADGQGLTGGVGADGSGQNLNGGINGNGLQMQTAEFENRKPLNASAATFAPLVGGITRVDVQRLEQHDVALIIDRSFSMGKLDCPPATGMGRAAGAFGFGVSRWDWCRDQTRGLANVTGSYNRGIKLLMFSRGFETFPEVTLKQVPSLFQNYLPNPETGTDMVEPLQAVLTDYLKRRNSGRPVRPLAIAVIFDGLARKGTLPVLTDAIVDASRAMRDPNEIKITIFIVGNRGPRTMQPIFDLPNTIRRQGARYNILSVVPFNQVQQVGLAKALADTLRPDQDQ